MKWIGSNRVPTNINTTIHITHDDGDDDDDDGNRNSYIIEIRWA